MANFSREEIQRALDAHRRINARADAREVGREALAEMFTEDATFIDPAWGRFTGREDIRRFMRDSMQGLDDWSFPVMWTLIDGNRVIIKHMNRLPGQRPDGTYYEVPIISTLEYAGNGKFSYEEDILNMAHLTEVIVESGWTPGPDMNFPEKVVR